MILKCTKAILGWKYVVIFSVIYLFEVVNVTSRE